MYLCESSLVFGKFWKIFGNVNCVVSRPVLKKSFGFNLWKVARTIQKIVVNLVTLSDSALYFNLNIICEDYVIKGKLLGRLEIGNASSFVEIYFTCSLQLPFLLFPQREIWYMYVCRGMKYPLYNMVKPVLSRFHFSGRPPLSGHQGRVVRKPGNANPGLKFNRVSNFSFIKVLSIACVLCRVRLLMLKTEGHKI